MAHFSEKTVSTTRPDCNRLPLRGLTQADRLEMLRKAGVLRGNAEQGFVLMDSMTLLQAGDVLPEYTENRVGAIPIPLGLATNVRVNGHDRLVTMATEESTVVAGVSKAAKLCWPAGFTVTSAGQNRAVAQILFTGFSSLTELADVRFKLDDDGGLNYALIRVQHQLNRKYRLGSEAPTAQHHVLNNVRGRLAIVVTVFIDTADLADQNVATIFAEKLARLLEPVTGRRATAAACSHNASGRIVEACAVWPKQLIGQPAINAILELQDWANADQRRARTHNKEVLNGIEAVARATYQDTRAIYASVIAATDPRQPLTKFSQTRDGLEGILWTMLPIGLMGGATENTFARACTSLMGIERSSELAEIMAAVGLAASLAALLCLVNEGFTAARERVR